MAWNETSATAWDGYKVEIGTPKSGNEMSDSLENLGHIKTLSIETEEGEKKEWKDINGKVIDSLTQEGKLSITTSVKNLNKSLLEKVWDIEEDGATGDLKIKGMTTSNKYSVKLSSSVKGAEIISIPYCSVSAKLIYDSNDGYMIEAKFEVLSPGKDKPLYNIGQTP